MRLDIIVLGLAIFFISGYFFMLCYTDYQQLSSFAGQLARAMRPSLNDYYQQITLYTYLSGCVAAVGLCLAFVGAVSKAESRAIQRSASTLPPPPPLRRVEDPKVTKRRRRNIAIAAVTVVAVALALMIIPFVPVEATFNDSQPYSRAAKYIVVSANLRDGWELARGTYHTSEVVLRNTDLKGGDFVVTHKLYDTNGLFGTITTSKYVGNGSTATFSAEFDTQFLASYHSEYSVSAPTINGQETVSRKGTVYKSIIDLWFYR